MKKVQCFQFSALFLVSKSLQKHFILKIIWQEVCKWLFCFALTKMSITIFLEVCILIKNFKIKKFLIWKLSFYVLYVFKGYLFLNLSSGSLICQTSHFCTQYCDKKYYDIWQFLATDFYWSTEVSSLKTLLISCYVLIRGYLGL